MKPALGVALLVLLAAFALPADAAGPVEPTMTGPASIPAARNWTYGGQLVVDGTNTPVRAGGVTVGVYVDGVRVAQANTNSQGGYGVAIHIARGTHTLIARVFEGTAAEGASAPLTVVGYPTWPAGPGARPAGAGFYYTDANVSWYYPWTDGGYPVTSFQIQRSHNGGPFSTVFTGLGLNFTDANVLPNQTYVYRGTATTSYGTSNVSAVSTYASNPLVSNISIVGFRLCDAANCSEVADGGSFTTNVSTGNVSVLARTEGIVDHYPIAPPGVGDKRVHGRVHLPEVSRSFLRTSQADGTWTAATDSLWAHAPVVGCETFGVVAHAHPDDQGRMETTGSFTICVA